MNTQIVTINQALKSLQSFYLITAFIAISLFLSAGFISVSVIWFFALCLYNYSPPLGARFNIYRPLLFPIALFLLNVPWLFFSDDLHGSIDLMLRKSHLFLIPFGLIAGARKISEKALHVILALFLLVCVLGSFICLALAAFNVIRHGSFVDDIGDTGGYYFTYFSLTRPLDIAPVYLSLFFNFAFLIGLNSPFIHPLAKRFVAFYISIFIVLISSAVGIGTLVVISFIWLLTSRYQHFVRYVAAAFFISVLVASFHNFQFLQQQFKPDFEEQPGDLVTTMPSRLAIWSSAWEAISESPVVGFGPAGGQRALEKVYRKENFNWGIKGSLNPHNEFLSTLLDLGVVGFSLLLGGLVYSLILSIRMKDRLSMCFIVIIFLFFCFESVLVRQKGIVFFSFFYSILFSNLSIHRTCSPQTEEKG